ncbi:MAG: hydrophobe/amphiphile efflux-1 family transporter, partial [Deltaproteobacteria bacterium]|nr:hydrophobe/amphiphile efflux-1 family transporter [Deltaproteobacteria bacterium]
MPNFFIRRPIVAIVISILTVMLGAITITRLSVEQYPFLAPPNIRVTATYPGASAEAVEQSVATPIEQEVNGVDRLIYMKSSNTSDGRMLLDVNFEVGTDQDMANVLTQNRVSSAQARLPQEVIQQGVTVKKQSPSILMVVSLGSPNGSYDANFLINYCGINLRDQMLRIPGIAQVDLFGGTDYGMRIWIRPDRLAKLGLTPADVIAAIKDQNLQAPAGKVGAAPTPKDQMFTNTVSAPGRLVTIEEFENIIVSQSAAGDVVRLRDVGRAELGSQDYNSFGRLNGKPSGAMAIYLLPGANQLKAAETIYETMERAKELFPPDVNYDIVYDTTPAVEASIHDILKTFIEALILVTLVVFIFLQNIRATIIPLITIPVSLVGTFIFFPALGFSINTLSMFGLVLAIGIVVDDAIVVVEAVIHHLEHGMEPKAATIKAMEEVQQPVIGIALILSAVFVPVALLGGLVGSMYKQFALTIAISVLLSAFNALSL